MINAKTILSSEDFSKINGIITDVESKTSSEYILAVSTESGRYDRAEAIFGIVTSIFFLPFYKQLIPLFELLSLRGEQLDYFTQALTIILGFTLGNFIASYFHNVRRLFCSTSEMEHETSKTAHALLGRIKENTSESVLLVYISLFERRVHVVASNSMNEKIGHDKLEQVKDIILDHFINKDYAKGLELASLNVGEVLSENFPSSAESTNHLSDHIRLFHPRP